MKYKSAILVTLSLLLTIQLTHINEDQVNKGFSSDKKTSILTAHVPSILNCTRGL